MKRYILIFFLLYGNTLHSQSLSLPSDSLLYNSLFCYYTSLYESDKLILDTKSKRKWLSYLPSLGITYATGKPRPLISFSANNIIAYYRDQDLNRAKKIESDLKLSLTLQEKRAELEKAIRIYNSKKEVYENQIELLKLDELLFEFDQAKYDANLILPSEYISHKKRVQQQKLNSKKYKYELTELYYSVLKTAKFIDQTSTIQK